MNNNVNRKGHVYDEDRPRFVIMGVGGSGCNTIYRMYQETNGIFDAPGNKGVKIYGLNTDQQSLKYISKDTQIQTIPLGLDGLGAGSNPETGRLAAEYSAAEIQAAIEDTDIVIIVAGFGGGTGTGAAPFIAELAKKMGKLVLGFITKPFFFEGIKKLNTAQEGLKLFIEKADTTIVLSNQLLFSVTNANTSLSDAYLMIDKVSIELVISLIEMLKGIAMMNVDFADFKKATQNTEEGALGIVGFGEATGADCGKRAVEMALSVPLFEPINAENVGIELQGASHILIHIVSEGAQITLSALESIVTSLTKGASKDASIKVGVTVSEHYPKSNNNESFLNMNESYEQKIKIVFIATGFKQNKASEENISNKYDLNLDFQQVDIKHDFNVYENTSFLNSNMKKLEEEGEALLKPEENKKKPFNSSFLDAIKSRFNFS
jgi:cell division protein FtsZ